MKIQNEFGSFSKYIWDFVDGKPIINRLRTLSDAQATGMVNDHMKDCWRKN